jgi:hypothetical protein
VLFLSDNTLETVCKERGTFQYELELLKALDLCFSYTLTNTLLTGYDKYIYVKTASTTRFVLKRVVLAVLGGDVLTFARTHFARAERVVA